MIENLPYEKQKKNSSGRLVLRPTIYQFESKLTISIDLSATALCLVKQCAQNSLCTVVSGHETCEPKPGYRKSPTNAADIVGQCGTDA